jgi:hypothetical protein
MASVDERLAEMAQLTSGLLDELGLFEAITRTRHQADEPEARLGQLVVITDPRDLPAEKRQIALEAQALLVVIAAVERRWLRDQSSPT